MDFKYFNKNISKLINEPIGGMAAQLKLAPTFRKEFRSKLKQNTKAKKAAVLALFYPNETADTHFLLTLRASYNGTHSAQISFPGGKYEKNDTLLKNTALRETQEEVGIEINDVTVFKELTNVYIPPSNFVVTPFMATINYKPIFVKNNEVDQLISVSLKDFLVKSAISKTTLSTSYAKNIEVPCFKLNNYIIWGATAMILSEMRELLKII